MSQNFKNFIRKFYRKIFYHTPPETIQTQKKNLLNKQVKLNKIFGVDFSKVSVNESAKALNKINIKNQVVHCDGGKVDKWAKKAINFCLNFAVFNFSCNYCIATVVSIKSGSHFGRHSSAGRAAHL